MTAPEASMLGMTRSSVGMADEQTHAASLVPDGRAKVLELPGRRVEVEDYNLPRLQIRNGDVDIGDAGAAAWVIDPRKNASGMLELRDDETAENLAAGWQVSGLPAQPLTAAGPQPTSSW
jgi:hypothetical protein